MADEPIAPQSAADLPPAASDLQRKAAGISVRATGQPQGQSLDGTAGGLAPAELRPDPAAEQKALGWTSSPAGNPTTSGANDILHAFGQGFADEWGSAKFGPELKSFLQTHGVLYGGNDWEKDKIPALAFNEAFLRPVANLIDIAARTITGLTKGTEEAAVAAGVPKDVVGMTLENPVFAGGSIMGLRSVAKPSFTGGTGGPIDLARARDIGVIGEAPKSISEGTAAEAAAAIKPPLAFSGSPYSFTAFVKEGGPTLHLDPPIDGNFFQVTVHAKDMEEFERLNADPAQRDNLLEVTHQNGVPVKPAMPAVQANDLVKRGETVPANPMDVNPWQQRFDEWVGKLETTDQVKALIRKSAEENGGFVEARNGQIPEQHLGLLSDATGIPRAELNEAKLRQTFRNDQEFRAAGQLMLKTNDDVFEAARLHSGMPTSESRQALIVALMRRDLALETVLGLRAEWGRTGNVMQEFLASVKETEGVNTFLGKARGKGWDANKIDEIADKLGSLNSRESVGQFLSATRKPDFLDKVLWYWTNSLLSGLLTHAKYTFANAAYLAHDTLIATPMAGISGAARQALSKEQVDRVYLGETPAKVYGLIAGVPDALYAAGRAFKTNMPTPLPPQLKGAGTANPVTQLSGTNPFTSPVGRKVGEVLGVPSRGIAGIHSFFNFLGYRSEIEAQAYRKTAKAGYSPLTKDFWQKQHDHAAFPDDPMMDAGIAAGERANFVQDLGEFGQSVQSVLYKTRIGRFVVPFMRVPGNIFNAVQEGTPFAFLDQRMRDNLLNKDSAIADQARGRLMGGAAIMGWGAYMALGDNLTGNGPIDAKQRAEWLLTHQPRSIKVGDTWKGIDRFGPVGGWLSLSADLTDAARDIDAALAGERMTPTQAARANKDVVEAMSRVVLGFTKWFEDAGLEGAFNLAEELQDPQKTRASGVGATAATTLPFSTFLAQGAAFQDPYQRDAKTFLDGIRNRIPGQRETLLVARDWTGLPKPNPAYQSLLKNQAVNADPVDAEMQRLDLKPTKPADNIRGIKLTPEQYDDYQTHAGLATRTALHNLVAQPGWSQIPAFARSKIIEGQITASRSQAAAYMQAKYPALMQEGLDERMKILTGDRPKPGAFQRP